MKKVKNIFFILGVLLLYSNYTSAQSYKVYMGLLHSHTMLSDGSGTPEEAFKRAKQKGLNFFAVTEHNHAMAESGAKERKDGVLIATNPDLYNGNTNITVVRKWKEGNVQKQETVSIKPLIKSAVSATTQEFVALYGQEFSTISSGNHMNVIGIDNVITVENGNFKELIGLLEELKSQGKRLPVLQLNHPDVQGDLFHNGSETENMFNDYGIDKSDLGPHFKDMVSLLDPYVSLIEVISGPALTNEPTNKRPDDCENDYYFYLKQGFHISPSVGQDNHYKTWGSITDARVGVLAETLTQESLFQAFEKNRTFATEDKNLHAYFYVNGTVMGSSVNAPDESELGIKLIITDKDEPGSGYTVEVYGGNIESELSTHATNWKASDGRLQKISVSGNGEFSIKNVLASPSPSFIYIKIIQEDGDELWTAPLWINDNAAISEEIEVVEEAIYYWSKSQSSTVYHKQGCSVIKTIKAENLSHGSIAPAGRTEHACSIVDDEGH